MPAKRIVQNVTRDQPVPGGREIHLTFRLGDGDAIPTLLLLPDRGRADRGPSLAADDDPLHPPGAPSPSPAALLLHGYSSNKELLSGTIGRALLHEGVASLSLDLPHHGARAKPGDSLAPGNLLALAGIWRQALSEIRVAVGYLRAHSACDARRLAVVGYSMGSFLALELAAKEPAIRAVALAAGGDLPQAGSYDFALRMLVDPIKAVRRLDGRPLLMVHGRQDRTVTPEQALRLYEAAGEPKEIRWWDAGHRLPEGVAVDVARWVGGRVG